MTFLKTPDGPHPGREYELQEAVNVLGRHPDCQVIVEVGAVSRQHAQIEFEKGDYYVSDLESRNGTFLNEEKIEGRRRLVEGDCVKICDVEFFFHKEKLAAEPKPTSPETATIDMDSSNSRAVMVDDMQDSGSTVMSTLDVSSRHGRVHVTSSPQVKLEALLEITSNLGKALALEDVLPKVLDSLFRIFVQADRGFIVMEVEGGELVPLWTKVRREGTQDTIRISRTIVRHVMESKEATLSADAASDPLFEMSQSIADFRIRSMMCAPLLDSEGNPVGVLQVDTVDQRKRFQTEDLEVLASVATQAGIAIDNAKLHERALEQQAIERDLEVAVQVQKGFLPDRRPELESYSFFDYYEPANHVGGDYFDYIQLKDGRLAIIVADVVGHGVAAALMMAKLSAEAKFSLASESQVNVAVNNLNNAMTNLQLDRFVTLIMAVLNPETHEVTIVNAGHMAPMRKLSDGQLDEPGEDLAGLPIGIMDDIEYEPLTLTLEPGELLIMYTDGINECADANGKLYGIERIRDQVNAQSDTAPQVVGQAIIDDVRNYLNGGAQDDDMCLVCFGRAG